MNIDTSFFRQRKIKAVVSLIEYRSMSQILNLKEQLLHFEYQMLDFEKNITLFRFKKSEADFNGFAERLGKDESQCCYTVANIFYCPEYFLKEDDLVC